MNNNEDRVWIADPDWVLLQEGSTAKCRYTISFRRICKVSGVAQLKRGNQWWAYCGEHLYGRRIRDGRVEVSVAKGSPMAIKAEQEVA
ncbi:hypothetical protein LCGC14_2367560 [marine sediment metagenome]|uniref:Uncharacterized protein n=1 Tax=marine sediment metagenome TaxID=412755 RepID=A0A0F9EHA1_9ZZZZ